MLSIFDDGSRLEYDSAGNVVSHTDSDGNSVAVPPAGGSAIVQQFANLFNYGVRAAIDSQFRTTAPTATAAPGTAQSLASNAAQMRGILVIAAVAFVAFKLLK